MNNITSKTLTKVFLLFTVVSLQACSSSGEDDSPINGDWVFTMSSPFGVLNADVTMQAARGSLQGAFDLGGGRVWPVENGAVSGSEISFNLDRDGSPMVYEMSGTVSSTTVEGTAKAMGTEAPWRMTKKN